MRRRTALAGVLLLLIVVAGGLFASRSFSRAGPEATRGVELLWDTWGVPHIYASDTEGLFYAFGWAQMASHGDLVLRLYGEARGRSAEYWGEPGLPSDRWVRTVGIPARAQAWYDAQTPEYRRYLDEFAAGMNAYARHHERDLDPEVRGVLPVRPTDVLAHLQRVVHFSIVTSPEQLEAVERGWAVRQGAVARGSNAWAIGPTRSATGRAMLLTNPHLPWEGAFRLLEAQLTAPGVSLYGATLVGLPILSFAFNDHLGWAHTINTLDGADVYELTLEDGGYQWNGAVRPFEVRTESLKVRREDGSFREEELVIRTSLHGPVGRDTLGKALALRVAGLDQPHMLRQYWEMGKARTREEFEAALDELQVPIFTVMYADREGQIMHVFGGRVPRRPQGDWDTWLGVVPGTSSSNLWTETLPYERLPRVVNPPSGWLQNANDAPWTTTFPRALTPDTFPSYLAPRGPMSFRAQRSARMIDARPRISFDDVVADKHSTRSELADRVLDELIVEARRSSSPRAIQAAEVLARWDRQTNANSRGAMLFRSWALRMMNPAIVAQPFREAWDPDGSLTTPRGLANPVQAVALLDTAAAALLQARGALDVPWGDVYRVRQGKVDLPANGGPDLLGVFRALEFDRAPDGRMQAVGGDTYVSVVEFGTPVRAQALLGYGNSSQPRSRHLGDQLQLFARKELRPVWRTRAEVERNLESRESL
jgi:acyl-homoserine-lactone acylase